MTALLAIGALALVWLLGTFMARAYVLDMGRTEPGWAILTWPVWVLIGLATVFAQRAYSAARWPR